MSDKNDKLIFGLNPNIFWLGAVSFLTDVSSELIFTLLPLFLSNVLQTGTVIIGLIEGVAESTASLLKIASGWLSDKMGAFHFGQAFDVDSQYMGTGHGHQVRRQVRQGNTQRAPGRAGGRFLL
jgi:hypothetical protein